MDAQDEPVSNIAIMNPNAITSQPEIMPFGWGKTPENQNPDEEPEQDSIRDNLPQNNNDKDIRIDDEDTPEIDDPCAGVLRVLDGDFETKTYWAAPKDDPTKCRFEEKISDKSNESLIFVYIGLEDILVDSFPNNVNAL
jgi:hypothetical protein